MAYPFSRLEISIPLASADGKFYGRYPHGDSPTGAALSGAAQDFVTGAADLTANSNPMGINLAAGGGSSFSYEGQPWAQDRILESRGFTQIGTSTQNETHVALDSSGWPTTDFMVVLNEGGVQDWYTGTFQCGFNGTGAETITAFANCSVTKTSGASPNVRFTLTPSGPTFGFNVSGTSGGAQNVFAYLPAYASQAATGYSATPLVRNEFVNCYKGYGYLRDMWMANAWNNSASTSWANRNTAANTKSNKGWSSSTGSVPNHTIGYPIEWFVAICNACGLDAYCCMPVNDDGTYAPGAAAYLKANLLGECYIEYANELWNGQGAANGAFTTLTTASGLTTAQYLAVRVHSIAGAFQAAYGTGFGTRAQIIAAWQAGGNGIFVLRNMLAYYNTTYGAPKNDIHWLANAPYMSRNNTNVPGDGVNHCSTTGETIAQIQSELTANGSYQPFFSSAESLNAVAITYGLTGGTLTYEMGWEVGTENKSPTTPFTQNVGVAITDAGMQSVDVNYLQACFNAGYKRGTWFQSGVISGSDNLAPDWSLSDNTTTLETTGSARSKANAQFFGGATITHRNVVAAPGTPTTIAGSNYLDHNTAMGAAGPSLAAGASGSGVSQNYAAGWSLYSPAGGTYTLSSSVTQTGVNTTNVTVNGVLVASGVSFVNGAALATITLKPGFNYVEIGKGSFANVTSIDSLGLI